MTVGVVCGGDVMVVLFSLFHLFLLHVPAFSLFLYLFLFLFLSLFNCLFRFQCVFVCLFVFVSIVFCYCACLFTPVRALSSPVCPILNYKGK